MRRFIFVVVLSVSLACAGDQDGAIKLNTSMTKDNVEVKDDLVQKQKDIKKLIVLTSPYGDSLAFQKIRDMTIESIREISPEMPDRVLEEYEKEFVSTVFIDLYIPIYNMHLSHADIKELIKFYETPAGKRISKAMVVIEQEGLVAGKRWGQETMGKVFGRLEKEYSNFYR